MSVAAMLAACVALAALAGLVLRSWWVVAVTAVAWPLYFLGLHAAWWGSGVGDGWLWAAALLTVGSILGAAAGVAWSRRPRDR